MLEIKTFEELEGYARSQFIGNEQFQMILLCRYTRNANSVSEAFIQSIPYIHHMSGSHADFSLVGYSLAIEGGEYADWISIDTHGEMPSLRFSNEAFSTIERDLERRVSSYRYQGGVDLIIVKIDPVRRVPDWGTAYFFRLGDFIQERFRDGTQEFFVRLVDYIRTFPHSLAYDVVRQSISLQRRKHQFAFIGIRIGERLFNKIVGMIGL